MAKIKEIGETIVALQRAAGILDRETTLGDASTTVLLFNLLEKAEGQLAEARKKETTALNKFQMVEQALKDAIKFAKKDIAEAKKGLAECGEKRAKRHRRSPTSSPNTSLLLILT